MPSNLIKKLAKDQDIPVAKIEKYWAAAKKSAAKKFKQNDKAFFPYVTAIVKKRAGIKESSNFAGYYILEQAMEDAFQEVNKQFHLDQSIEATDNILTIDRNKLISDIANNGFVIRDIAQEKDGELLLNVETSYEGSLEELAALFDREIKDAEPVEEGKKPKDFSGTITITAVKDDPLHTKFVMKAKGKKFAVLSNLEQY